jgi:hypothetical protein
MKELEGLVCRLEACLQEELGSSARQGALLERQERAVRARDGAELGRIGAELERELSAAAARGAARDRVLARLAAALGAPRSATTLASLAARLEPRLPRAAARVARLRAELRDGLALLARQSRRTRAAIGLQRRVIHDVLETLLGGEGPEPARPLERTGSLIDAEA